MTMTKLGTMIYEDGTDSYSVFTFNFEIQNQLDNISCHSPELAANYQRMIRLEKCIALKT